MMQNKTAEHKIRNYCLIIFVIILLFSVSSAVAGTPSNQLKVTLDRIIDILNDQELKAPEKKNERRQMLLNLIRQRFDEEVFSEKVLGRKYWKKRTEKEKKEFIDLFSDLLLRSYVDKIDAYLTEAKNFSSDNIKYEKETLKGKYAVVATKVIIGTGNEVMVYYRLINKNNDWFVCDLAIEGVSIVKNYRAQFRDIIANSSFQDLLKKLKEKEQQTSNAQAQRHRA